MKQLLLWIGMTERLRLTHGLIKMPFHGLLRSSVCHWCSTNYTEAVTSSFGGLGLATCTPYIGDQISSQGAPNKSSSLQVFLLPFLLTAEYNPNNFMSLKSSALVQVYYHIIIFNS